MRAEQKDALRRLRAKAAEAEAGRKRASEQLAASLEVREDERNAAVRRSKELEAKVAEARRDLKVARRATRDAEAELLALRSGPPAVSPAPAPPSEVAADGLSEAVQVAAAAAADLAALLADAAGTSPVRAKDRPKDRSARRSKAPARRTRAMPVLPPGTFDATPEAHRHLLADPANLVVVDGYNVARAAWSGLAPEEERRRVVALLEDVEARSGGRVTVVFDGDDAVSAPRSSKRVLVRFSATGQTADDAIVDLLAATPLDRPVVVVSSDRAVAADARRQGAVAMGSAAFLLAAGR